MNYEIGVITAALNALSVANDELTAAVDGLGETVQSVVEIENLPAQIPAGIAAVEKILLTLLGLGVDPELAIDAIKDCVHRYVAGYDHALGVACARIEAITELVLYEEISVCKAVSISISQFCLLYDIVDNIFKSNIFLMFHLICRLPNSLKLKLPF